MILPVKSDIPFSYFGHFCYIMNEQASWITNLAQNLHCVVGGNISKSKPCSPDVVTTWICLFFFGEYVHSLLLNLDQLRGDQSSSDVSTGAVCDWHYTDVVTDEWWLVPSWEKSHSSISTSYKIMNRLMSVWWWAHKRLRDEQCTALCMLHGEGLCIGRSLTWYKLLLCTNWQAPCQVPY